MLSFAWLVGIDYSTNNEFRSNAGHCTIGIFRLTMKSNPTTSVRVPSRNHEAHKGKGRQGGKTGIRHPGAGAAVGAVAGVAGGECRACHRAGLARGGFNFGCPAKLVNQSKGGAVLLKEPDLMYRIIAAVRCSACRDAGDGQDPPGVG